jgi:hypothetical protein
LIGGDEVIMVKEHACKGALKAGCLGWTRKAAVGGGIVPIVVCLHPAIVSTEGVHASQAAAAQSVGQAIRQTPVIALQIRLTIVGLIARSSTRPTFSPASELEAIGTRNRNAYSHRISGHGSQSRPDWLQPTEKANIRASQLSGARFARVFARSGKAANLFILCFGFSRPYDSLCHTTISITRPQIGRLQGEGREPIRDEHFPSHWKFWRESRFKCYKNGTRTHAEAFNAKCSLFQGLKANRTEVLSCS